VTDLAAYGAVRGTLRGLLDAVKAAAEGEAPSGTPGPGLVGRLVHEVANVAVLARRGLVAPMRPDKPARMALSALVWGPTLAAGVSANAIRHGARAMLVDELGELSWSEMDRRTSAIACGLRELGLQEGDAIGLMARNHRGFVEAAVAAAKLGADVLLLNTAFAAPQLADVTEREKPVLIVHDEEFTDLLSDARAKRGRVLSWVDDDQQTPSLGAFAREHDGASPSPPERHGRVTILTSGTTGTPKGASRGGSGSLTLDAPAGFLERIPLRAGGTTMLAAPLFHAWGLANFAMGLALGSTFVLRRKFDPEATLADVERHGCDALVAVPVMLQRILDLDEEVRDRYDTSSLRIVAASGSALPGDLATHWMDEFGDNLYNLYGSTEVSNASIATPADMRAAPGTSGRPPRGTVVRILDEHGGEVPQGGSGRIFVGNSMLFEGYTGGEDKQRIGGLVATGDVGRFDAAGRLFVEGRDDEMIVSGGENVFPAEVEDALARHPAVSEAACIGVDDEQFGQRLKAFVVLSGDASEDDLKRHVKDNLARYKVPREIEFLDELPRNAAGKVLKRELAERDQEEAGKT
jgi:fatty-acyl-CoA synthase